MDNNTRASKSDLEQYGCRVRIRVDYLSVESEKTADSLYEKAREFLREACPVVPVSCIDWAHHIGSEYKSYRNKKKSYSITVRFTSSRHRIMFYRNTKLLKDVRIKLNLAERRYGILRDAIDLAKEDSDLAFIFEDVHCHLKVVLHIWSFQRNWQFKVNDKQSIIDYEITLFWCSLLDTSTWMKHMSLWVIRNLDFQL